MAARGAIKKQVEVAVEVQNHLSTVEAAQHPSSSRCKNCDNSNKPDLGVFEDTINLYMEKLYIQHLPNLKYNKVYINLGNPNHYFPLTIGVVQTWAQALVSWQTYWAIKQMAEASISLMHKITPVIHGSGGKKFDQGEKICR
ncbi:uncharacterized protein VP01_1319g3 [Puccinia sorghi]|uniref:Uncharacterized protein n=1 Tax=Puccinia sorghi TaxID=27349 RepID=A0A0L6VNA1_9BASI|nr:uncharacterized protein VP01_1319g3 [Puccinia sorghi]